MFHDMFVHKSGLRRAQGTKTLYHDGQGKPKMTRYCCDFMPRGTSAVTTELRDCPKMAFPPTLVRLTDGRIEQGSRGGGGKKG